MTKMSKELKAGSKIACFIEQRLENCLVVRFQNDKAGGERSTSVFRGVLIDEASAATKRIVNSFGAISKPRLTKELTTTFIQNCNSKSVSGKALRSKNKPSCLVLDDFCIDYHHHHTNLDAKPEKKKQYLKPGGKLVPGNTQIEFSEKECDIRQEIIPAGGSINKRKAKEIEEESEDTDTIEVAVKENSNSSQDIGNEQSENRYSKRSRKPKQFFDSEVDSWPIFCKRSPTKSRANENKKKEVNSSKSNYKRNAKYELQEKPKIHKRLTKVSDKRQEAKNKVMVASLLHGNATTLKRSARNQCKRSKSNEHVTEISDAEDPLSKLTDAKLIVAKRRKLETNEYMSISDQNVNAKATTLVDDVSKNSVFVQKVTGGTLKRNIKSPRKSSQKLFQKSPKNPKTVSRHEEELQKGEGSIADQKAENYQTNEIDDETLLCNEQFKESFKEKIDKRKDFHKRLGILKQAEKILGGKVTLLHPEEVAKFERYAEDMISRDMKKQEPILMKGASLQVSQVTKGRKYILVDFEDIGIRGICGKKSVHIGAGISKDSKGQIDGSKTQKQEEIPSVESTQLCAVKSNDKVKDVSKSSKIIIDRGKGIVSIQRPAHNEQKEVSGKDGEQLSKSIVSEGNVRDRYESDGALIIVSKRDRGINKSGIDAQSSDNGGTKTDIISSPMELYSSESNDSDGLRIKEPPKQQSGSTCETMSNDRKEVIQACDKNSDSCLSRENNEMKSIYAELSFNRLLASVHEEAEKAHPKAINNLNKEKSCKMVGNFNVGTPSSMENKETIGEIPTIKNNKKLKKGDLLLQVLQKSYKQLKNKAFVTETLEESTKGGIQTGNGGQNVTVPAKNNSMREVVLGHSLESDSDRFMTENIEGGAKLGKQHDEIHCVEIKENTMLLDELIAVEGGEQDVNEKIFKSRIMSSKILDSQNFIPNKMENSMWRNKRGLNIDLGAIPSTKVNFFKSNSASHQPPSIELISGLRNIENKVLDFNREQKKKLRQYFIDGSLAPDKINVTKEVSSQVECKNSWGNVGSDSRISLGIESNDLINNQDPMMVAEYQKQKECKRTLESHSPQLNKAVGDKKQPQTGKQRRKCLRPMRHNLNLGANAESHVWNEKVKETVLQFNGKKTNNCTACKTGIFINGKEGEASERKNVDETVRCSPNCNTFESAYSMRTMHKWHRHTKVGARKYPIPNRSWRRRNPMNCLQFLGSVFPGKEGTKGRTCDLISIKKPKAAREQGEELLKKMLKLNKGILIRKDVNQ